jgi:N-methylhydantoinase A/oxoprolinase/acetone carboxylase beta subunit
MLAMGWIDPSSFLGGRLALQKDSAVKAIKDKLCSPLNMSVEEAAAGAIHILTHSMTRACEINSIRRGFDVRDFALVAFGGAGPLFACAIANELSVSTIVIPPNPGLTSALGLLASDVVYEKSQTVMLSSNKTNINKLKTAYNELESTLYSMLKADGFKKEEISLERAADCRYEGQGYELVTPYPNADEISKKDFSEVLANNFHAQHEKQYGKSFAEKNIQIVNIRARGRGATARVKTSNLKKMNITENKAEPCSSSRAYFLSDGKLLHLETPRYSRKDLLPGHNILGPAIIDQMDSTTVVLPDWKAAIDQMGNIIISRGAEL